MVFFFLSLQKTPDTDEDSPASCRLLTFSFFFFSHSPLRSRACLQVETQHLTACLEHTLSFCFGQHPSSGGCARRSSQRGSNPSTWPCQHCSMNSPLSFFPPMKIHTPDFFKPAMVFQTFVPRRQHFA